MIIGHPSKAQSVNVNWIPNPATRRLGRIYEEVSAAMAQDTTTLDEMMRIMSECKDNGNHWHHLLLRIFVEGENGGNLYNGMLTPKPLFCLHSHIQIKNKAN
ncbi:unnamed protein product [Camellia sinensis]